MSTECCCKEQCNHERHNNSGISIEEIYGCGYPSKKNLKESFIQENEDFDINDCDKIPLILGISFIVVIFVIAITILSVKF